MVVMNLEFSEDVAGMDLGCSGLALRCSGLKWRCMGLKWGCNEDSIRM